MNLWACPECGALCPKENEQGHLLWHQWLCQQWDAEVQEEYRAAFRVHFEGAS